MPDPDVIVITGQNWSNPGSMRLGYNVSEEEAKALLRGFLNRPGWRELSAVNKERVYSVYHCTCSITIFVGIQALGDRAVIGHKLQDRQVEYVSDRFGNVGGKGDVGI